MRRVNVLVERDERLSIPTAVGAWEVPILEYIHGKEKVIVGDSFTDEGDFPNAEVEFDRLSRRYGEDIKAEKPFVSLVYGQPPIGVRELARAIEAEKAADQPVADPLE